LVDELLDVDGAAAGAALGVLEAAGVEAVVDAVSLEEPPFSLFSAFGDASAFSAAAFFPPSDFGALPLSPFG
jgi:hypothetical protein